MQRILFFLVCAGIALAQGPSDAPCTVAVYDCCSTTVDHVVINGVRYSYQVCDPRTTSVLCTPGCGCTGTCRDLTARCTCISPSPTPTMTATVTPTSSPTSHPSSTMRESMSAAPTHAATSSPTPSGSMHPTTSASVSMNPTPNATMIPIHHVHKSASGARVAGIVLGSLGGVFVSSCCLCCFILFLWGMVMRRRMAAGVAAAKNSDTVPLTTPVIYLAGSHMEDVNNF